MSYYEFLSNGSGPSDRVRIAESCRIAGGCLVAVGAV